MKKFLFITSFLIVTAFQGLSASVIVFTDIDDTIKQTDVLNKGNTLKHTLLGTKSFENMSLLFDKMINYYEEKNETVSFYYVSGSLKCITNQKKWLKKNGFPFGQVIQRGCLTSVNGPRTPTYNYKVNTIGRILSQVESAQNLKVFAFGDNGQHDAHVYETIKKFFPKLTIHAYVRDIATKAFNFHPQLSKEKVPTINYFLTEKEFFNDLRLPFIDEEFKQTVENDLKYGELFADYLCLTLSKRITNELHYQKWYAKQMAHEILEKYYQ